MNRPILVLLALAFLASCALSVPKSPSQATAGWVYQNDKYRVERIVDYDAGVICYLATERHFMNSISVSCVSKAKDFLDTLSDENAYSEP